MTSNAPSPPLHESDADRVEALRAEVAALRLEAQRGFRTEGRLCRLQERLDAQLRMMSRLYELGAEFHRSFDEAEILASTTSFALYDLGYQRCLAFRVGDDAQLRVAASDGYFEDADAERLATLVLPPDDPLVVSPDGGAVFEASGADETLSAFAAATLMDAFVAYPLRGQDGVIGLLVAGSSAAEAEFYTQAGSDEDTVDVFANLAGRAGAAVDSAQLYRALESERALLENKVEERTRHLSQAYDELTVAFERLAERDDRITADLRQARDFQRSILPSHAPIAGVDLEAVYLPAELVGGDIYDFTVLERDGGRVLRVLVADATGHGVQASLVTMLLKSEYDRHKLTCESPARALAALNDSVTGGFAHLELRCSALCLDLHLGDGALVYAGAAHPPAALLTDRGTVELEAGGPFIGLLPGVEFPEWHARLNPGDTVVAYTDGAEEVRTAGGLTADPGALLHAVAGAVRGGRSIADTIRARVKATRTGADHDDVTCVAVRWSPTATS